MSLYSELKNKKLKTIKSICAIGNPIIDITADISGDTDLSIFNMKPNVINYMNEENKKYFELIQNQIYVVETPGGSALNSLRALSWCQSTDRQGNNPNINLTMIGSVGNDIYRSRIINASKDANINYLYEQQDNLNTSKCALGNNNRDKYILSDISASENLSDFYVQQNWDKIIIHDALIIEGYFLKEKYDLCRNICDAFSNAGKYIILTLKDPLFIEQYRDRIIEIGKKADMIFTNYRSIHSLCNKEIRPNPSLVLQETHRLLNNNKERIILITAGGNGVFCSLFNSEGEKYFQKYPNRLNNNEIRDFNGAGDAFLGGFLYGQSLGKTLIECCDIGNNVASIVIKNHGCMFPNNNTK